MSKPSSWGKISFAPSPKKYLESGIVKSPKNSTINADLKSTCSQVKGYENIHKKNPDTEINANLLAFLKFEIVINVFIIKPTQAKANSVPRNEPLPKSSLRIINRPTKIKNVAIKIPLLVGFLKIIHMANALKIGVVAKIKTVFATPP